MARWEYSMRQDYGKGVADAEVEGRDVVAVAALGSQLTRRLFQEVRLSIQSSARERTTDGSFPALTLFSEAGLAVGRPNAHAGSTGRTVGEATGIWHLDLAPHRLKFGLSAGVAAPDRDLSERALKIKRDVEKAVATA